MALYRPRGPGCKCHAVLAQWRGGSVLPHPRCCARHACNWGDWQAARWPGAAPVITPPGRKWHAARTGGLAAACAAMPGHQRHVKPRRAHQCGRKCPGWLSGATRGLGNAAVTPVGFEPTPFRNGALGHRLRPLGQSVIGSIKKCYIPWHCIAPEGRAASATLCWPSGAAAACCRIRGVARGMPALGVIGKPRGGPGPRQS